MRWMEPLVRGANLVFALMFAFSVALQYNDPDPLRWMAIYAAAFSVCLARAAGSVRREFAWAIAAIALLWAASIWVSTRLEVPLLEALGEWDMHSGGSEEAREIGGLLLVAACSLLAGALPRARAPESTTT